MNSLYWTLWEMRRESPECTEYPKITQGGKLPPNARQSWLQLACTHLTANLTGSQLSFWHPILFNKTQMSHKNMKAPERWVLGFTSSSQQSFFPAIMMLEPHNNHHFQTFSLAVTGLFYPGCPVMWCQHQADNTKNNLERNYFRHFPFYVSNKVCVQQLWVFIS